MNWYVFTQELWSQQRLPPEKKYVLIQLSGRPEAGLPPSVVVGYLRYAAGDPNSPVFTTPGVAGGKVVAWSDCLPDDFSAPLWLGTN